MAEVINTGGIGFTGLLTIVFIILKLVGTITWSWWWVLSPIWIPVAVGLAIGFVIGLIMTIARIVNGPKG